VQIIECISFVFARGSLERIDKMFGTAAAIMCWAGCLTVTHSFTVTVVSDVDYLVYVGYLSRSSLLHFA